MKLDSQLDSLMRGLSARERAVLTTRALHEDRPEDPQIRLSMPDDQVREFNHYIALANGVIHVLLPYALAVHYEVEALEYKHLLIGLACAWGDDAAELTNVLSLVAEIPVPQSEYEQRLEEARTERLELRDVIELVQGDFPGQSPRDVERSIRAAVASGELPTRRAGRNMQFELGPLYAWAGKPVEATPDWGWRFSPVRGDDYAQHRWRREAAQRAVERTSRPSPPAYVLPAFGRGAELPDVEGLDQATRLFAEQIRLGVPAQWSVLLAVEQVTDEVRDEFGDEAAIPDALRTLLADTRRKLDELTAQSPRYVGPIEPSAADEATVERLRAGVRRDETLYL